MRNNTALQWMHFLTMNSKDGLFVNSGPLAIPEKGRKVVMNRTNFFLYRQLIDWEQKKKLSLKDGRILLGDSAITQYRFEKDYYFVAGDNMANSQDSRYWGCYRKSIL